jgi:hypothetical protein
VVAGVTTAPSLFNVVTGGNAALDAGANTFSFPLPLPNPLVRPLHLLVLVFTRSAHCLLGVRERVLHQAGIVGFSLTLSLPLPKAAANAFCTEAGGSKCVGGTGGMGSAASGMPIDSASLLRVLQVAWQ